MPNADWSNARNLILAGIVAALLPCAQSHAETAVAEPVAVEKSTPAQAISSSSVASESASPWILPQNCHLWARFEPGSWREIETITETFDKQGKIIGRSVTTQKEILKAVADDSYVVDIQATVEVAGKRIAGPWNSRVNRLTTDRSGTVFATTREKEVLLPLNVGEVKCQVVDVQYSDESRNLRDRIYFSPAVYPHVLERHTSEMTANVSTSSTPESTTSVVAQSIPFDLEGRILDCVVQRVTRRRDKGESQAISLLSAEVPGGEIHSHSTDFDTRGKRVRWSVQRLSAYGISHTEPAISGRPPASEQK